MHTKIHQNTSFLNTHNLTIIIDIYIKFWAPIRRTDKGRVYSRLPAINRDHRPKCMASKHLYTKYHTAMYVWMAYTVSTPCAAFLQPPLSKRSAICQFRHKQHYPDALYKQRPACSSKVAYRPRSPPTVPNCSGDPTRGHGRLCPLQTPQGLDTPAWLQAIRRRAARPSHYPLDLPTYPGSMVHKADM